MSFNTESITALGDVCDLFQSFFFYSLGLPGGWGSGREEPKTSSQERIPSHFLKFYLLETLVLSVIFTPV